MSQSLSKPRAKATSTRILLPIWSLTFALVGLLSSAAPATTFNLKDGQSVVGELRYTEAQGDETLLDIALEFELGYEELESANPNIDPWKLKRGTQIILPLRFILPHGPRDGVYINMASYRLYYYPKKYGGKRVVTYPVSIGRGEWPTPEKSARIIDKLVNPTWYPPKSVRQEHKEWGDELPAVVPAGPDNPLGKYALQLDLPGYLIHGTNKPYGIGMNVTHGCVRLRPNDIQQLFAMVPRNTPVRIINEPYLLEVENGVMYLEAHGRDMDETVLADKLTATTRRVLREETPSIDWHRFAQIATRQRGIPTAVSTGWRNTEQSAPVYQARQPSTQVQTANRFLF